MGQEVATIPKEKTATVKARKMRRAFLIELAKNGGRVAMAAKAVGYTDTSAVQKFRRENEEFAEGWEHAVDAGTDMLEEEAFRRAHDGTLKPVLYKGEIATYITEYSDALLTLLLKARRPDKYREAARGGETNINVGIAVLPMTATNEADWQDRALLMHSKQTPLIIEAKPVENQMAKIVRGD